MTPAPMPVLFVGHGNPMNAVGDNRWSRAWKEMAAALPRPRAILAVSAHWYLPGTHVTGDERPRTIHDFGGFPDELYQVQYPAPGDAALAETVRQRLAAWDATTRTDWGLDHGTWSVLRHMYPKADVPIVQLSIDARADPDTHWAIGAALAPLRDDGVLVAASGNLVHNLPSAFRKWRAGDERTEGWATDFDQKTASAIEAHDGDRLRAALDDRLGALAHPTPDHYLPVLYGAAAAGDGEASFPVEGFDMGDVSMRCVRWD